MTNRAAMPDDVGLPGRHYNTWTYIAKAREGEDIAAVSDPAFWIHLKKRIKPTDRVEVLADTGEFELAFRVVAISPEGIVLREVFRWESDGSPIAINPAVPAVVEWGGPNHKWRIKAGDEVVRHGFTTEAEASQFLADRQGGRVQQQAA